VRLIIVHVVTQGLGHVVTLIPRLWARKLKSASKSSSLPMRSNLSEQKGQKVHWGLKWESIVS